MIISQILTFLAELAVKLVGPVLAFLNGIQYKKCKDLEAQNEILANRPISDDDLVRVLDAKARAASKRESQD